MRHSPWHTGDSGRAIVVRTIGRTRSTRFDFLVPIVASVAVMQRLTAERACLYHSSWRTGRIRSAERVEAHLRRDAWLFAARFSASEIVAAERGVAPDEGLTATPVMGGTLLHLAVEYDDLDMVRCLARARCGCERESRDRRRWVWRAYPVVPRCRHACAVRRFNDQTPPGPWRGSERARPSGNSFGTWAKPRRNVFPSSLM